MLSGECWKLHSACRLLRASDGVLGNKRFWKSGRPSARNRPEEVRAAIDRSTEFNRFLSTRNQLAQRRGFWLRRRAGSDGFSLRFRELFCDWVV